MPSVDRSATRKSQLHKQPASTSTSTKTAGSQETKKTSGAAKTKEVGAKKTDDNVKQSAAAAAATAPKVDVVTPALNRAFFTLAKTMETEDAAGPLAQAALREFSKSPEAMAAFKQALPYLESSATTLASKVGAPQLGKAAAAALPLVANGKTVKALLEAAHQVGGPNGRRLVGAALRGLNTGKGMAGAAAELSATAAKIAAKAPALGAAAGGVAKALPVVGNAVNVLAVGASLKSVYDSIRDPAVTKAGVAARVMHLAATVTGCFIPPAALVAAAIDVKQAVSKAPA